MKTEYFEEITREIIHLRNNTTDLEKSRLDICKFDSKNKYCCIYGLMTGSCDSDRAKQLYPKTKEYVSNFLIDNIAFSGNNVGDKFTALEQYIYNNDKYVEDIISYIKGMTNTLSIR